MVYLGIIGIELSLHYVSAIDISELHKEQDLSLDVDARKRICRHVTSSGFFRRRREEPIDFDYVYQEIKMLAKNDSNFEAIAKHYSGKTIFRIGSFPFIVNVSLPVDIASKYLYPTETIQLNSAREELAFACLTRQRENRSHLNIYFISNIYNIRRDVSQYGCSVATFVFQKLGSQNELIALAEEPAIAFSGSMSILEDIYLQMRSFHKLSKFW